VSNKYNDPEPTPPRSGCNARKSYWSGIPRAFVFLLLLVSSPANAQSAKIVGLGATGCSQFTGDIRQNPNLQRDYLAWAQGYMSGLLQRAPSGVDEGLDLLPPTLPLLKQLQSLRDYCSGNPSKDFSDAVVDLYRRLRSEGST
jgi:hypothetical protein